MSNYLALYRKWRPRNFADLVGQEHVARTLSNAITSGQLAHAYLFTGPRGTGKTSSARIFAKSLNCAQGPTVMPCEECPACQGINKGSFPDVIEIDAASNRGVDDARDLRDRVRFAPTHGRFKVFIIDEVHMLTNEAFNALLKTIEEPPPNLVFVLATTDVHKVLPTIISRCQRFDFQRIAFKLLVAHLRHVAQQESMVVADAGLEAIAKRADGGLRDALSLLDQVRACASSQTISAEDVYGALGIVSNEAVAAIATAIADSRVVTGIEGLQALLGSGYDHHAVVRELVEFFRNLMLIGIAGERTGALELPEAQLDALRSLAQRFTTAEILYVLEVLRETEAMLKGSNQMTIWLEMAAIRLCNRQDIPSIAELTRRVSALEERLASGASVPAPRPAARPVPPAAPAPAPVHVPAPSPAPATQAPVAAPPAVSPTPAIEATVPAPAPIAAGDDALGALLPALAKVHRSTHSLVEQHALYARLDGETLTLGIKATMRSFFEKADRKAYLDKAVSQAFAPGVRLSLSFEQGDSARPKLAGAAPAPASFAPSEPLPPAAASHPAAAFPAVRETVSTAILDPFPSVAPVVMAVESVELPPPFETAVEAPVAVPQQEAPPPAVRQAPVIPPAKASDAPSQPVSLPGDELVNRAADIFNGRVIEPTL